MIYLVQLDDGGAECLYANVVATATKEAATEAEALLHAWVTGCVAFCAAHPAIDGTGPRQLVDADYATDHPWPFPGERDWQCYYFRDQWRVMIDEIPVYANQG